MRNRILTAIAESVVKRPWWSLLWIFIVTAICAVMASQLETFTSITSLMPEKDPAVMEYMTIMEEFDGASSFFVVAEGDEAALEQFVEEVVPEIKTLDQWVKDVVYRTPRDFMAEHGLMLMKSGDLENSRTLFEDPNLTGFLTNLNDSFEKEYIQSEDKISSLEQEQGAVRFLDGIQTWVEELGEVLEGDVKGAGSAAADAILYGSEYLQSWDGRTIILQLLPTFNVIDIDADVASTDAVEEIVERVADKHGVRVGLTGSVPIQRDEMVAVKSDSFTITLLALVGILIIFMLAFRMVISPVLAILTLVVGILWALGITWLLAGRLTLLTTMMGVILLGIGIDFSIHIISVYTEMRARGENVLNSLIATFRKSGAGITTGATTTAIAFLTLLVADIDGMREFGWALAIGILMTMLAALTVLPTMLVLRERIRVRFRRKAGAKPAHDVSYGFLGAFANWLARRWGFSLIAVAAVMVFFGYRATKLEWDYNMLNLEPKGLESIELIDRLLEAYDMDIEPAMIAATSLEEARTLTDAARDRTIAGTVESITDLLPPPEEQERRRALVEEVHTVMVNTPVKSSFTDSDLRKLREEIDRLEANVMEIQSMAVLGGQDKVYLKSALLVGTLPGEDDPTISALHEQLRPLMPNISSGTLSELREQLESINNPVTDHLRRFHSDFAASFRAGVLQMANTEAITLEDLPPEIRKQYVGKSGDTYLVYIYPKQNVWELQFLRRFSDEMAEISPRATGMPSLIYSFIEAIKKDGQLAIQIALVVIFLVLLLDFRNVKRALLAIVPLIFGVVLMAGTMHLTGLMLTFMNIMAIPMIIGIGIDDGVHIVHRYQLEGNWAHRTVFSSTGRAVLLTSLTTMLGFGSLYFATMRSLGSLGTALFIGVGTCFVASVLVIPVLAGLAGRLNGRRQDEAQAGEAILDEANR
ncbi:MAG: MMPL family transporter [Fidelibacterota bacterium]|nr:MAG: MMPL family transporter [Candidatus Neomarinimicrobiota bacterium]